MPREGILLHTLLGLLGEIRKENKGVLRWLFGFYSSMTS